MCTTTLQAINRRNSWLWNCWQCFPHHIILWISTSSSMDWHHNILWTAGTNIMLPSVGCLRNSVNTDFRRIFTSVRSNFSELAINSVEFHWFLTGMVSRYSMYRILNFLLVQSAKWTSVQTFTFRVHVHENENEFEYIHVHAQEFEDKH